MGPEGRLESMFAKKIKEMGGLCYKWIAPGHSGVPDRLVIIDGKIYPIEFKTYRGVLSPQQHKTIEEFEKRGVRIWVVYGEDGVENMINIIRKEMINGTR